jgi:hypothetical protein
LLPSLQQRRMDYCFVTKSPKRMSKINLRHSCLLLTIETLHIFITI